MAQRPPSKPPRSTQRPAAGKPRSPREQAERAHAAWGVKPDRPDRTKDKLTAKPKGATAPKGKGREDKAPGTGPRAKTGFDKRTGPARPASDRYASDRPVSNRYASDRPAPKAGERTSYPPRIPRNRPKPAHTANPHPAHADAQPGEGPPRIAKLLARAGIASRREIERMITEGRVALNGELVTTPATLLADLRGVTVDNQPVQEAEGARLFLFHKPSGCLTTERDPAGRPTIYDRLPAGLPRVMPIGRLDMSTEGLLLLTNDGELKRAMELPANGVERTYRARAFGEVSQAQLEELIHGIEIEGVHYARIDANLERRTGRNQWIEMTLTEGKNREVRRVLEFFDLEVNRLIRTRYGPFELGDLPPGKVLEISESDLNYFRKTLEGGKVGGKAKAK